MYALNLGYISLIILETFISPSNFLGPSQLMKVILIFKDYLHGHLCGIKLRDRTTTYFL